MPSRRGLWFSVLGPVRAWSGAQELDLGTPQCRLTLGVLLLRDGGSVLVDELVEALWTQTPPRSAVPGVRTFISRLRRILAEAGHPDVIEARQGTYRLLTGEDTVDARYLRRQLQLAAAEQQAGDLTAAASSLRLGLAQWQGTPLGEADGPFAEQQRAGLQRLRLSALEQCASVDLARDEPGSAVATLSSVIGEYPFDERLRELLMLGLLRTGRPADALRLFHSTSRLLGEELGVDPGPALQTLHQEILQSRPVVVTPVLRRVPAVLASVRPLHGVTPGFIGRADLIRRLADQVTTPGGGAVGLAGLTGTGKTALAVQLAHHLREQYPDGQVLASLHGRDEEPVPSGLVLSSLLGICGGAAGDPAEAWQALLRERRFLIVLDDAHDAEQLAPLLPRQPGSSAVVVTSQRPLRDSRVRTWCDLPALHPDEALDLLRDLLGPDRVDADPQAARHLVGRLSGLPFAIRYAAAVLEKRPHWSLASERVTALVLAGAGTDSPAPPARQLQRAGRRLPADLARAFSLMSLTDGGRLTVTTAALLLDVGPKRAQDLLEGLLDRGLIARRTPLSYEYPSLVREYARTVAVVRARPDDDELPSLGLICA
ncbi:AfsR/SARP family transcriptional regulator [Kineosporia succinea]|uniref:DNA-binding SARP family transcriptional activator n=1 Tax=Kineosporia succinea TaxID=84632 RepID=A0ABT9PEM9_9ACTN|nr:AfsR/SARP family transcriptional regulator [Kineosporia succinea]MDP9830956.1 DNA-binding SARP family transcriptional activator [Kineosporia succinea]